MTAIPDSSGARPQKILVVDDDQVILKTLSFKLKTRGYEVITASDGSEGVSMARQDKPDLILLDLSFPPDVAYGGGVGWDGFRIINWIRHMDDLAHTPIIIISSSSPAQYEQRALEAGAMAYFQKPIDHNKLLETIRDALKQDSASPPGTGSPPNPIKP